MQSLSDAVLGKINDVMSNPIEGPILYIVFNINLL